MKKIIMLFVLFTSLCFAENIEKKINAYAGKNKTALLNFYKKYMRYSSLRGLYYPFIIKNAAPEDLAVLTPKMIEENVELAIKTKNFAYAKNIPHDIFKHFVLPLRISQEPFENWRENFYNQLKPKVENFTNIEEAAVIVDLFTAEQLYFKQTNGRDQAPLTSIKRGYGRCEEMMILLIAALRSVGIPARGASVPFWNFTDNNHAWVEIYTPDGWKLMEGGIPITSQSNHWVPNNTRRTTIVQSRAYGMYDTPNALGYKNHETTINTTPYYTTAQNVNINVVDEKNNPVPDANISFYAVSYGGIFNLYSAQADDNGKLHIKLGKSSAIVTAGKDSLTAINSINMLKGDVNLTMVLKNQKNLDKNFELYFDIPKRVEKECKKVSIKNYKLLKELANLKRDKRVLSQQKPDKFIKFLNNDTCKNYIETAPEFIKKTSSLAGAANDYLYVYSKISKNKLKTKILNKMILNWDVKELIEMPDTTAILNTVNIFEKVKGNFKSVSDSIFYKNVMLSPFGRVLSPQNGWQQSFYNKIKHLVVKNNINKTVKNVKMWLDKNLTVEENHNFSYFTGSINPLQILNMQYVSGYHKLIATSNALRLLGVPLKWQGFMLYYNGKKFIELEKSNKSKDDENITRIEKKLKLTIDVDKKQIEPKPYSNFLLSTVNKNGEFSNTYFKPEIKNNIANIAYFKTFKDEKIFVQAYIRNQNGDANLVIKQINTDSLNISLKTLDEYISTKWNEKTIANVKKIHKGKRIVFVRGKQESEPEIRMLKQFVDNFAEYQKSNTNLVIYTENKNNPELNNKSIITLNGKQVITENLNPTEYPAIFLFDTNNNLIFTSKSYNMGIADYIKRKLK